MSGRGVVDLEGIRLPRGALLHKLDIAIEGRIVLRHSPTAKTPRGELLAWPEVLLPFLRGSARVTVTGVDGTAYVDEEVRFDPTPGRAAVADGRGPLAVDKFGLLQRTFDERSTADVDAVLDQVETVLATLRGAGVHPFLAGGALLGAVRGGALIGHDSDVDLGYVSNAGTVPGVTLESYRLERAFMAAGMTTSRFSGGEFKVLVRGASGSRTGVDVRAGFVRGDWFYLPPDVAVPISALPSGERPGLPLGTASLHGRAMPVPASAEAFLHAGYGPGWRTPDPHFVYGVEPWLDRRLDGWLRGTSPDRGVWQAYHRARLATRRERPSEFAEWVAERIPARVPVLELGCGDGRDAVRLAQGGRRVIALDFSPIAVERTRRSVQRAYASTVETHLAALGDLRHTLLWGSRLANEHDRSMIYARHLVDVLDVETRRHVWLLARSALRRGGRLFVSTGASPSTVPPAIARRMTRRPVDGDLLVQEIEDLGGQVVHRDDRVDDRPGEPAGALTRTRLVATWQR